MYVTERSEMTNVVSNKWVAHASTLDGRRGKICESTRYKVNHFLVQWN